MYTCTYVNMYTIHVIFVHVYIYIYIYIYTHSYVCTIVNFDYCTI